METNFDIMEIIKAVAINLNAKAVTLVDNKKYRFHISAERIVEMPKDHIYREFLRTAKIDVIQ